MMKMKKTGFTLIELLVVIVIIGILSTISTATFKSYFGKARDAERVAAVQSIALMMKVDAADEWSDAKYLGAMHTSVPATNVIAFNDYLTNLFSSNDFRVPKAGKELRYYIAASACDLYSLSGATGDNNQFIVVTWGETKSTAKDKSPGTIADGTEIFMNGDSNSHNGFANAVVTGTSAEIEESDFRAGTGLHDHLALIETDNSIGDGATAATTLLGLVELYISPSGRLVDDITKS